MIWLALLLVGCGGYRDNGRSLEDQLEREVVALHQKARTLEAALETCGEGETQLYTAVHQIFAGSEVVVEKHGRFTTITLPAHYAFGSELTLRDEARMAFDLVSTVLQSNPDVKVQITGHTEQRMLSGKELVRFGDLWGLGYTMASTLRNELVDQFDIETSRFIVASAGPGQPLADNDTELGQRTNRRIVVHLDEPARAP